MKKKIGYFNFLGWIDMSIMLSFKRLLALTKDPLVVMSALEKSPNKVWLLWSVS